VRRYAPLLFVILAAAYSLRWFRGCATGGLAAAPLTLGEEPLQEALDRPQTVSIERDGAAYHIQKTHRYRIVGEVVSASVYALAFTNDFYDVDIGIAWGAKVESITSRFTFYQDHRWLFWRSDDPISGEDRAYVTSHVGNQHLIPAEGHGNIDRAVRWARVGDRVAIEGYLVTLFDQAWQPLAKSSTSRSDTGGGACEIIWVDRFQNGKTVWQ
jgi:hypothetical protein